MNQRREENKKIPVLKGCIWIILTMPLGGLVPTLDFKIHCLISIVYILLFSLLSQILLTDKYLRQKLLNL